MSVCTFRAALIVDGEYISAWQYWMLERLLVSRSTVLVGVVFRQPVAVSWSQRVNRALLKVLQYFDGKLFGSPAKAQIPTSILPLLGDITLCDAGSKRYQAWLADEVLDVVIEGRSAAELYIPTICN